MSDRELVTIDAAQFARLDLLLTVIGNALWAINDQLKPIDNSVNGLTDATGEQTADISKWLAIIADKLTAPTPPIPTQRGTIMAKFRVPATNPDITIQLTGSGFTDEEGNATGAGDIDLSVESSNPDAVSASLSDQTLSDDKQSVSANVSVHFGAPATDIAVLTYRATNRDTSAVVAAGTDEFAVEVGEATLGSVTSTVPLTPEA